MHFQVIARGGDTVDSGAIDRPPDPPTDTSTGSRQ
jgi:hypothetical protein